MAVTVAKHAGYCFGVRRAMECAEGYAEKADPGEKLYTYGHIIHNKEAIKKLEQKGVLAIESLDEIHSGKVFIRAHGVPPEVYTQLNQRNLEYIDCTCPYVKKIHKIVEQERTERQILIIGDDKHPEVIGINGWAGGNAQMIHSLEEAKKLPPSENKISVVVQTTFNHVIFAEIEKILTEKFPNAIVHNTTCLETDRRQKEAVALSKQNDIMLVVGDKSSANTRKLYDLCKQNCKKALFLETIFDLQLNNFERNDRIGITAGASTMPETLKEVAQFMSEMEKNTDDMLNENDSQSFEDMLNESLVSLHTGDVVKGSVISINNEEVSVNLGYKSDGIIERGEYSSDPSVLPSSEIKAGDEIEVYVLRVNDGEGNVLLSRKRLEAQKNMEFVEQAFDNNEVIEVKVIEIVKAGLIGLYKGIRIFIPYSQISNRYVEDISVYKGATLNIKILELDKAKRRIVGGRKELAKQEEDAKREEVFSKLNVGDKVSGTVSRIVAFGAFVDLGGVDGLIHISELSWGSVKNPKDVLKEGQSITAVVLDVNKEKGKIGLSLKDINEDPWKSIEEKYKPGDIVTGKVARIAPFGAFIELEEGVDGLVHISQISTRRIEKCEDELTPGEEIQVKVMEVNPEKRKISLSKKEVDSPSPAPEAEVAVEAVAEAPAEEIDAAIEATQIEVNDAALQGEE